MFSSTGQEGKPCTDSFFWGEGLGEISIREGNISEI
jgi:hypothetical protein